jgi:hypothetical protein
MRAGARLLRLQYLADYAMYSSTRLDNYVIHLGHAAHAEPEGESPEQVLDGQVSCCEQP